MIDYKLSETTDMLIDFFSLIRDGLFLDNDFFKKFPLCPEEFQKNLPPISLPPSHMKVILYLAKVQSSPISQIANKLGISKSNMTPIIDKLIELDLVSRYSDKNDRRVLRVELTPKSVELFNKLENVAKDVIKNKISSLSDDDLVNLNTSLYTLSNIFKKLV